jgi:hypothetical protein
MPELVALQTMVPQFANPADLQAKAYNVRNLALQNQAAELARADDQAARAAFAANPTDNAARLSALAGVSPAAYGAEAKRQADLTKTSAETRVKELEAAHKANDMRAKAFGYVRQYPTLENANNAVKWLTDNGIYTPEQAAGLYAEIQKNPTQIAEMANQAWYANLDQKDQLLKFEKQDLGGQAQIVSIDPVTGQTKVVSATAKTQSPDNKASNERMASEGRLNRANQLQVQGMMTARQNDMPRGQVVQTDDGPVLVNPRTGTATQVTMDGQPVQAKAKSIPASVQKAMTENDSALRKIEDALAAVNEYPDALGGMNMLGDTVRQRTDPKGVKARALVADIGSLKLHDRSGAAVTAAETPRLKPFIPSATDTPDTVRTKLGLFKREYQAIQDDIRSAYPKETSKRTAPAAAPAVAPALPAGWSVEVR